MLTVVVMPMLQARVSMVWLIMHALQQGAFQPNQLLYSHTPFKVDFGAMHHGALLHISWISCCVAIMTKLTSLICLQQAA